MKKEINKTDRNRIFTLKLMTEDILNLFKIQEKYIQHLFNHFQNDRYLDTNFFKEGTIESKIYDFLDSMDRDFCKFYMPLNRFLGAVEYYLDETSEKI